jgi:peptidoglycan-N-acetylglucosamine deacetylase
MMMLREMMATMQAKGGVWFATGEQVALHVRKMVKEGKYSPRVDKLPFYEGRLPELADGYAMKSR